MSANSVSARAAAGAAAASTSIEQAMSQLAIAAPAPQFLETTDACNTLARLLEPVVARILATIPAPGARDEIFASMLGPCASGTLQRSLPVMGPPSEESATIALWNIDTTQRRNPVLLPLMSFTKPSNSEALLSHLNTVFDGKATIAETVVAYVGQDDSTAYSDVSLPKSCQALCNQYVPPLLKNSVKTLQNLMDAAIIMRMDATAPAPISAPRQRYVIALAPERTQAKDWAIVVKNRTSHPVVWVNYATKESQPMVGAGVHYPEMIVTSPIGQYDRVFSGTPSYWRFHEMQQLQRDFVRVQAQTTQQTVVLACARLISTVTPPFVLAERQPQLATKPPSDSAAAQNAAAKSLVNTPQTVLYKGGSTCALSNAGASSAAHNQTMMLTSAAAHVALGAGAGAPAAGAQTTVITDSALSAAQMGQSTQSLVTQSLGAQTMALPQMSQVPRQVAAAPAVPYTRITQGSVGMQQTMSQDQVAIARRTRLAPHTVDTTHAELLSFQIVMVHCPDTVEALPGYLRQLMGRIRDIKEMMLAS